MVIDVFPDPELLEDFPCFFFDLLFDDECEDDCSTNDPPLPPESILLGVQVVVVPINNDLFVSPSREGNEVTSRLSIFSQTEKIERVER